MAKPQAIQLGDGTLLPILYEDRSILAIDKPAGWMLAPTSWDRTGRNLQRALESSVAAGDFWARSRHLKYLRFIHRLDAETSGLLLLAKNPSVLRSFSRLFEGRQVQKVYLAVVEGVPSKKEWACRLAVTPDPGTKGRMRAVTRKLENKDQAKAAETHFRLLEAGDKIALIEARPTTGRTHQIRVHLAAEGHPVLGDTLYGSSYGIPANRFPLGLRAIALDYRDPFSGRAVHIEAPVEGFAEAFGFHWPPAAAGTNSR